MKRIPVEMEGLTVEYEVVIGLEIHAELATKSKIYCGCTTEFGGEPNTHCCPGCMGMPGALSVLNKAVVEYAIKAGLATNCEISHYSRQDRKHYFYPDLAKAYQISQCDFPICRNGFLEINVNGDKKKIGITRIHIEEDAGKLIHDESGRGTFVDYNRSGVPLIEIVTEPDMRSSAEVKAFFEKLKAILEYTAVSDCKMQEGSLRADINLSVRPKGQSEFGVRTEMKNLNSIRAIVRAVEGEARRQILELEYGGIIEQETRRWDDIKGESYSMRTKEEATDYRYMPDPDLAPVYVEQAWIDEIRATIPELPDDRKNRFINEFGIPEYDASLITASKPLADFFEAAAKESENVKAVSNWIMGDLMKKLNDTGLEPSDIPFAPGNLSKLISLIDENVISGKIAKQVFEHMWDTGEDPADIVEKKGLKVVTDTEAIRSVVIKVISANPKSVEDYKSGKTKAMGFLIGQIMRETKGKADPQAVNRLLKAELDEL
jgi:aspartyl-tRNA(Asn)/glutamyl-tRNA(Gln) amidotransferase subunit B